MAHRETVGIERFRVGRLAVIGKLGEVVAFRSQRARGPAASPAAPADSATFPLRLSCRRRFRLVLLVVLVAADTAIAIVMSCVVSGEG